MKAMQCELCGATDIIKDGDFFVCQSCGMKYTPESAKKMMVEGVVQVEGTVKIDSSQQVENYIALARKAKDLSNYKEAEDYANKVLEIEPNNCIALYIKGEAAGWQSSIGDSRINEAIDYFHQSIANCSDEQELKNLLQDTSHTIASLLLAMLKAMCKAYESSPTIENASTILAEYDGSLKILKGLNVVTASELQNYIHDAAFSMALSAVRGHSTIMNEAMNAGLPGPSTEYARNRFYSESVAYIKLLDFALSIGPSDPETNITFYDSLTSATSQLLDFSMKDGRSIPGLTRSEGERKLRTWETAVKNEKAALTKAKADSYWEKHSDEKEKLQENLSQLDKTKQELLSDEEYKNVTKETEGLKKEIEKLEGELKKCGVFAGKDKKRIRAQLDELEKEFAPVREKKGNVQFFAHFDSRIASR